MDFGTMRAKLHEGFYTSLEQFEHDVFLISGNTMHFNSSGTIFFRQAHAIDKLAKRVFHVLKTNPENFESEFSGSRRRSCRKPQDETNDFNGKLISKSSEKTGRTGDNKKIDLGEVDRRSTYKPDLNLNSNNWSKSLIHLNQHQNSYAQSLMQFVKDLGPTAQMVAKRKLQNLTPDRQPINLDLNKQPQIQTGEMWFNYSISRGVDLRSVNGVDGNESSRDRQESGGGMDSIVTSMTLPPWIDKSR